MNIRFGLFFGAFLLSTFILKASVLNFSRVVEQDSTRLNIVFSKTKQHIDNNRLDSASAVLQKAKTLSFISNDSLGLRNQVRYLKFDFDILFKQLKHKEILKKSKSLAAASLNICLK